MRFRPERPPPQQGFQAEGLLIIALGDAQQCRVYVAAQPDSDVPSIRVQRRGDILRVTANGPVDVSSAEGDLKATLARVGDSLANRMHVTLRPAPTVWCSWYHYFVDVTEQDILENLHGMADHDLPVDVVQIDDGWQAGVGDWLQLSTRFSSTRDLAARIAEAGRRPGIWLAPFIAGVNSDLARSHPDWLVGDAGYNWGQQLSGLDLTHPDVQGYLTDVFRGLREQGYDYFKLDFLYGGALPGARRQPRTPVEAYRDGLKIIREAVGPDGYVVGCGAPILPSIGLVDAMRVSADTYNPDDPDNGEDVLRGQPAIEARAWQHGRLWVNDPDCLVARPLFARRGAWAQVIESYGGLRSFSDRIAELDTWGLDTARRLLSNVPPPRPFTTLPVLARDERRL